MASQKWHVHFWCPSTPTKYSQGKKTTRTTRRNYPKTWPSTSSSIDPQSASKLVNSMMWSLMELCLRLRRDVQLQAAVRLPGPGPASASPGSDCPLVEWCKSLPEISAERGHTTGTPNLIYCKCKHVHKTNQSDTSRQHFNHEGQYYPVHPYFPSVWSELWLMNFM